jgi:hypothetical protein
MTTVSARAEAYVPTERSRVITNSVLVARRIQELQRQRQRLVARQEQLRALLPDWAIEPLCLIGMTRDEVRGLVAQLSSAEAESGLEEVERRLDEVDHQIEELETLLVTTPSGSLDEIASVLRLALTRFRELIESDPENVFYDHGEARLLALVERASRDLDHQLQRSVLDAG